jgi:hypothetical protein
MATIARFVTEPSLVNAVTVPNREIESTLEAIVICTVDIANAVQAKTNLYLLHGPVIKAGTLIS